MIRSGPLQMAPFAEPAGSDAAARGVHARGLKAAARLVLEPHVSGQHVEPAVAVHVERIETFGITGAASHTLARLARVGRVEGPGLRVPRVRRNVRNEQRARLLIPEQELWSAGSLYVGEDLIVMLIGSAILDESPLPGTAEIRIWILPPPQTAALRILAEDKIEIAVAVNVVSGTAGFQTQELLFDNDALPSCRAWPKPDQRRTVDAVTDDKS
jgi:hypothetical protein